jgi:hypothetical protein
MQATYIQVIDMRLLQMEQLMTERSWMTEKVDSFEAMELAALSQMWIFSVYELLRTWKSRSKSIIDLLESGTARAKILELRSDPMNFAGNWFASKIEEATSLPKWIDQTVLELNKLQPFMKLLHDVRVPLAKHENPGKKDSFAPAPGYARIDQYRSGSVIYTLILGKRAIKNTTRREISDLMRTIAANFNDTIIPNGRSTVIWAAPKHREQAASGRRPSGRNLETIKMPKLKQTKLVNLMLNSRCNPPRK